MLETDNSHLRYLKLLTLRLHQRNHKTIQDLIILALDVFTSNKL